MKISEINKMNALTKTFKPISSYETKWITSGLNEEAIEFTKKIGFVLCDYREWNGKMADRPGRNALTNSQIRNVFGEVKRIQMKISGNENEWNKVKSSFLLLQPKLAYATGRVLSKNKGSRLEVLNEVITTAIKDVKSDEQDAVKRFLNFVDFFEAILAYHKAFGGKE